MSSTPANRSGALLDPATLALLRLGLGIAIVWSALTILVSGLAVDVNSHRPLLLTAGGTSWLAVPLIWLVALVVAPSAAWVSGRDTPSGALFLFGWGLALWSIPSGTIETWLAAAHPERGAPTGGPYWALVADYLVLLIACGFAVVGSSQIPPIRSLAATLHLKRLQRELATGLFSVAASVLVILLTMRFAMGPAVQTTRKGQVIFAVFVSCYAASWLIRKQIKPEQAAWLWVGPILAGLIGAVVAATAPTLAIPDAYQHLDLIPAWWAVRPWPVELVGWGLVGMIGWSQMRRNPV